MAATALAPASRKKAADSSAESMLFAPLSHMLDGFVTAAARGAEEAKAKATAAAAEAEASSSSAAAAGASALDPASSASSAASAAEEHLLLASAASDGVRAAAAETAALWARQLTNERRSLEAARARYSADLVQLAELGICSSTAAPRRLMKRMYDPLVQAVREEQIKILDGAKGMDRRQYGPFLLLLPPEDYAALALQGVLTETLKLSARNFRGRGGSTVVETFGNEKKLEVSDAEAEALMSKSARDPLTAFDAALEAALPSAAEEPSSGLRGALGRAASRESGFAPFTGLARMLGRGVRDQVCLGRLAAVVDREGKRQGKLVELWDAARRKVAARGKGGLTPDDERSLLEEFSRVGSTTASYLEEEALARGIGWTAAAAEDAAHPAGKPPLRPPKRPKKGSKGTAESGRVYVRYSALSDGSSPSPPAQRWLTPAADTFHDAVKERIDELTAEIERRKRGRHLRKLRKRHFAELAEYKEKLRRFEQQPQQRELLLGAADGGESGGGSGSLSLLSATPPPPPPPPVFLEVKHRDYVAPSDRQRWDKLRGRALEAVDNVFRWTKDDAVKVGGALMHLIAGSATVEVPIPDDEHAHAHALGGPPLVLASLASSSSSSSSSSASPAEGDDDEEEKGKEKGGAEDEEEEEEEGGDGAAKAKAKAKAQRQKNTDIPIPPGTGEVIRRHGRAYKVEPAFSRVYVRGGGKNAGGIRAHPQVLAEAFSKGDQDAIEQMADAGAAKAAALQRRFEGEQERRKGEEYYNGDGRGSGGGGGGIGGKKNKGGKARGEDAKDLAASVLGPFAAERGALGLVSDVQLPMLVPPVPWRSFNEGGYLVSRSSAVRCKDRGLQRRLLAAADDAPPVGLSRVYAGLNALGSLPWRINAEILDAVERSIESEGGGFALIPPTRNEPIPQRSRRLARRPPTAFASATTAEEALAGGGDRLPPYLIFTGAEFPQEFIARRRAAAATRKRNREAHAMRCDLGLKLAVAREFRRNDDAMYFPHNLDFRGRAYPMHPHLNHLGSDVCRGLLTFGAPLELGREGYEWLLLQVANSFGKGADKLPLEGRRAFAEERLGALLATADDPWGDEPRKWKRMAGSGGEERRFAQFGGDPADLGARWWLEADAPWQLLATAKELRDAHRAHPDSPWLFKSRLPVRVDGTCNGLQHYAALGRDEDGGRAVNLLPSDRPSDVYSDVAAVVRRRVERDAADAESSPKRARAARLLLAAGVDRGLIKQTVMTSVYGVTYVGAREQVSSRLRERGFFRGSDRVTAALAAAAAADPVSSAADPATFEDRTGSACFEASAYGALVTFDALAELFGGARAIMQWLGDCAALVAARDRAMAWTTPLGFPVAQPYRKRQGRLVQTVFQRLILDDEYFVVEQPISMPSKAGKAGGGGGEGGEGEWWAGDDDADDCGEGDGELLEGELGNSAAAGTGIASSSSSSCSTSKNPGNGLLNSRERQLNRRASVLKRRQRTAFPPNFIHALDSTHMLSTAARANKAGIAFAGVHDSFWTHAGTVDQLNRMLRDAFVELHSRPLLEDLVAQMRAAHPDISFPPLPARGKLDLEKVRQSTYFFS